MSMILECLNEVFCGEGNLVTKLASWEVGMTPSLNVAWAKRAAGSSSARVVQKEWMLVSMLVAPGHAAECVRGGCASAGEGAGEAAVADVQGRAEAHSGSHGGQ